MVFSFLWCKVSNGDVKNKHLKRAICLSHIRSLIPMYLISYLHTFVNLNSHTHAKNKNRSRNSERILPHSRFHMPIYLSAYQIFRPFKASVSISLRLFRPPIKPSQACRPSIRAGMALISGVVSAKSPIATLCNVMKARPGHGVELTVDWDCSWKAEPEPARQCNGWRVWGPVESRNRASLDAFVGVR